jgi:hypothetical protein
VEKQRQDESEIGYKTATGDSLAERKGERRVYQVARKRVCGVYPRRRGAEESREESRGWDRRDEIGLASHPVFGKLSSSSIFQPQPDSEFILG